MGYVREKKIFRLTFSDPSFSGLEVMAGSTSVGKLLEVSKMGSQTLSEEQVGVVFGVFADALISWNLENEDGTPVPATLEGLYEQDVEFVMQIVQSWMEVVVGVPGPLATPSTNGRQSEELLIPTVSL